MSESYDDRYSNSESATRYIKSRVEEIAPTLDSDDDSSEKPRHRLKPALWTSVVAGGIAGVVVDFSLYPLDTLKTRLQSKEGFKASGGFSKLYKGIVPVLLCSAPLSALFFGTYNTIINSLRTNNTSLHPFVYLIAASAAELLCSAFRVPLEVVKQRKQTTNTNTIYIVRKTFRKEGMQGFYRGFWSLIMREIPFSAIQYPVWEYMLTHLLMYQRGESLTALQTAYCGAAAGAIAAILTTPVDVVKTRVMLAEKEKIENYKPHVNFNFAKEVYYDRGITGFFAGVVPRTLWIMFGGFIYFGAYEKAKLLSEKRWCFFKDSIERVQEMAPSYVEEKLETFALLRTIRSCTNGRKEDSSNKQEVKDGKYFLPHEQKIMDTTLLPPSKDVFDEK